MTNKHFRTLSGGDQFTAILNGRSMPKWWAREFIREQGAYHRACWARGAFTMWDKAQRVLMNAAPQAV